MEKQYKAQKQLKLMAEKEKTQIQRKEFGEVHKKKIESAQEEINHMQKSINELKKDYLSNRYRNAMSSANISCFP